MASSINTSSPDKSSQPSFIRSKTMPAFRRALSMPSVDKSLASLRESSSRGLRRMSSFGKPTPSLSKPCSTESIPVFTIPDYTQPTPRRPPLPALKKVCGMSRQGSTASAASTDSTSFESVASTSTSTLTSTSTTTRRRSSSVCSVESFSSTEERITLALQLRALPSTMTGLLAVRVPILVVLFGLLTQIPQSLLSVIFILLFPTMAAQTPRRMPARRPYEREIILTDEQERHPPRLSSPSTLSRVSRGVSKAYRRTLRRAARARRASSPNEALAALFKSTPKCARAKIPAPVDPKTLASEIPLVVYSSPIALPLPKGPAPAVLPPSPRKVARKFTPLPTVTEAEEDFETVDGALCAGW
ncbi:hypothetical protein K438DRAFT_1806793 [Mycena galopus ATCC 62051]|nr:hypothetical protein K438DRAFT_1806793 [Mycena galopus ATCC 62051]